MIIVTLILGIAVLITAASNFILYRKMADMSTRFSWRFDTLSADSIKGKESSHSAHCKINNLSQRVYNLERKLRNKAKEN